VGKWKDGKQNGQGTATYYNGDKFVGEFKDGLSWHGTQYDKDRKIKYKYVNGRWIKQ